MSAQTLDKSEVVPDIKHLIKPTDEDYDGLFMGAIGLLQKENSEWAFTESAYIAGVYKGGEKGTIVGKIFDLDENEIGTFGGFYGKGLFIGRIQSDGKKAPIIGFLFKNDENFIGRIMSMFGPAPHVIGKHWVEE